VVETGSKSGSTSYGSVKLTDLTGAFLPRSRIFVQDWQDDGFYLTTFLLPVGNRYIVTAKGASGPRGVDRDNIELIIEITATTCNTWELPAGPHSRTLGGHFKVVWANRGARDHFKLPKDIAQRARKVRLLAEGTTPPVKPSPSAAAPDEVLPAPETAAASPASSDSPEEP
jgi:hypothetical protein